MIRCYVPFHRYHIILHFDLTGNEFTNYKWMYGNRPRITDCGNLPWSTLQVSEGQECCATLTGIETDGYCYQDEQDTKCGPHD